MDLHLRDVVEMAGIYSMLALSLNVIVGYAGIISVAHAAFLGIGAYSSALGCVELGWSPWAAAMVGCAVAGSVALIVGLAATRLHDDHLLLTTLGFGQIMYLVFRNWEALTNGPRGVGGIPTVTFVGVPLREGAGLTWLIWAAVAAYALFCVALERSPLGRNLRAVRDDDVAARTLGHRPAVYHLTAMAVGAVGASIAGSLLAHKLSFISSETGFDVPASVLILAIVIFGGRGSIAGCLAGAIMLTAFPEMLRRVGLTADTLDAPLRRLMFGLLLVVTVIFRPSGLLGKLSFQTRVAR